MSEGIDYEKLRRDMEARRSGRARSSSAGRRRVDPKRVASRASELYGGGEGFGGGGEGGAPSFFGQIGGKIAELGKGAILGLPAAAWDQTVGNLGAAYLPAWTGQSADDIRTGDGVLGSLGRLVTNESAIDAFSKSDGPTLRPKFEDVKAKGMSQPFIGPVAEDMVVQGSDVGELGVSLAPGGLRPADTEWGKASAEGRTFSKLVDTVGAFTLAGRAGLGAASRGARAAGRPMPRVEKAASAARVADDAIGKAILAPFSIPSAVSRYATGEGPLLSPIDRARSGAGLRENFNRTGIPQALANTGPGQYAKSRLATPGTKPMRDELTTGQRATGTRGHAEAVAPVIRAQRIVSGDVRGVKRPKDLVVNLDVAANIDSITRAVDGEQTRLGLEQLAEIADSNPEAFSDFVTQTIEPKWAGTTPDAFRTFIDYRLGRLDADLADDIRSAADEIRAGRTQRDVVEIDGEKVPIGQQAFTDVRGRLEPDLTDIKAFNEQSLKAEVLPQSAARVRADAQPILSDLQAELDAARRGIDEAPLGPRGGRQEKRRAARKAATARNRLTREQARLEQRIAEANEALDAAPAQWRPVVAMTRRMVDAADEFDWESYGVPQRWVDEFKANTATSVAEVIRTFDPVYAPGGPSAPFGTASTGSGRLAKKASSAHQKVTGQIPMHSDRQAALILSDIRQQETNQTMMRVRDRLGRSTDDFDIPEGADGPTIIALASEQAGEPMVAWDPTLLFRRNDGTGQILVDSKGRQVRSGDSTIPPENVTAGAVLVPQWVADAADYAVSRDSEIAQLLIDKPTRIFKGSVLALSPRWHVGNLVSGAIMMHAGGVTAADLAEYGQEALSELRAYSRGETSTIPRWLLDSNLTAQEMKALQNVAEAVENIDPDLLIKRPKSAILRAGGDVVRKGYEVNTFVDNFYKSVAYMKHLDDGMSPSAAVQKALDTMGDYDRMTPFERRVVKRVLPFWAWTRHIVQLSANLATQDPARVALNMWLADLYAPEDLEIQPPDFLKGAARVGEEWLSLSFMSPFDTTGSMDFSDPAAFLTENLNPVFGTASAAVFGVEPSFDRISPLSQPDTPYGQTGPSPLRHNPLSIPYIVGQNLPQFRAVYDEVQRRRSGGEGQRLFGTGERMGKEDPNRQLEDNVARLLGIPFPKTYKS